QVAPVWRAERPQKGRYRQFVQCDIDIIGESGIQAEAELLVASLATVDALGLTEASIRVNDRRLLIGMLTGFGFAPEHHEGVLITIDKLDKLGPDGVIAELGEREVDPAAVEAFRAFLLRPQPREFLPFGEAAIRTALPAGADDTVVGELVAIGEAAAAARGETLAPLVFDPCLRRGTGSHTGPIFELAHPSVPYSLGGGGRYDGMIGRFLGTAVPATGFSLGFERLVELVEPPAASGGAAVALVHDADAPLATLLALQSAFVARGDRARLVRRAKNTKLQLENLAEQGFTSFAVLAADEIGRAHV